MNKFILCSFLILIIFFLFNIERKVGLFDDRRYNGYISEYSNKFGVDYLLVKSVIKKESNLNPEAISNRGAEGLMQIMPKTAREIAIQLCISDYSPDKLNNPQMNIMFGTYYLKKLSDYYNNNLILTLAAYNAGIGNIDMWIKEIPGVSISSAKIPFSETKNYVRSVVFIYKVHKFISQIKL
jgi:soluble lytic murein transglycosylase